MKCSTCGQDNPPTQRFCGECGTRLALRCPSCAEPNPAGQKFCGACGIRLAADVPAAAPASYTPKHLADRILGSRAALEGERKQVTVLFADLKGSMELLADRDPEEARKILDPVLELMMGAVHRYEGTVNQVMGDGIMALFGAPIAHEDHATRACYAALQMQNSVKRYAEEVQRRHGAFVQIRVGLNSGEVVVRAIGSDLKMDYSAVGQTTHLAARMEQGAAPGSILLTADTLALAEGFVEVKALRPMTVKGMAQPVDVFEMVGAAIGRSRFQAATLRGLSKFVGRTGDMEVLYQALDQAKEGHGQVVGVVGEAGVGKSRLYYEFARSRHVQDCLVVETSSVSYGKATAFLPVIELLRRYFGIDGTDPARVVREKVIGRLLTLDRALEPFLPGFLWLLDVPVDESDSQQLNVVQRRNRTLDGLKRLLIRESQVQPVVLVAEDLHWIDSETQAFLDEFVESVATARVLLLVNYRPEYTHTWTSKTFYRQLRIDPLPPASAAELLDSLLGQDRSVQTLKPLLIQRTEGMPFFLEESVRALVEKGALVGEPGQHRLVQSLNAVDIPLTVSAILAARIDRLSAKAKTALQAAAVIGKDVPFELLRDVVGVADDEVRYHVADLQAAEFLYERLVFPDLEYTFKHALIADVAYAGMLHDRRRELHARVTRAIERLHQDRLEEHADRLAYHARRGELWNDLVRYGRLAGKRAIARSAFGDGAQHFREALLALDRLDPSTRRTEEAIDIRLSLRGPLWQLGQLDELLTVLREAEQMARKLDDSQRLEQVTVLLSSVLWGTGQHVEHRRLLPDLRRAATGQTDANLQTFALTSLANAHIMAGDFRAARDLLASRLSAADASPTTWSHSTSDPRVAFRAILVGANSHMGNFDEAIRLGGEALAIAYASAKPVNKIFIPLWLSWCYGLRGDFTAALELSNQAVTLSEQHGLTAMLVPALTNHGWYLSAVGQTTEGIPFIERGIALAEAHQMLHFHSMWLVQLAQGHLWNREPSKAEAVATRAMELARTREEPPWSAWACYVAGEAVERDRNPSTPEAHYRHALALSEPLEMRPLIAHCHAGLAKLYRRSGKQAEAHQHFTIAMTMFQEMGMAHWLEKARVDYGQ